MGVILLWVGVFPRESQNPILVALLDEAESFFISHIRQGLRILLFLFGNSY
eukprot:SAG25_NODE_206_length_11883_cov_5.639511_12_plen_51_part_00